MLLVYPRIINRCCAVDPGVSICTGTHEPRRQFPPHMRGVTCQQWRPLYVVQPPFSLNERARGCIFRSPVRSGRHGPYRVERDGKSIWQGRCFYYVSRGWLLEFKRYVHDRGPRERMAEAVHMCFLGVFFHAKHIYICVPPAKQVPPRRPTDSKTMGHSTWTTVTYGRKKRKVCAVRARARV